MSTGHNSFFFVLIINGTGEIILHCDSVTEAEEAIVFVPILAIIMKWTVVPARLPVSIGKYIEYTYSSNSTMWLVTGKPWECLENTRVFLLLLFPAFPKATLA